MCVAVVAQLAANWNISRKTLNFAESREYRKIYDMLSCPFIVITHHDSFR